MFGIDEKDLVGRKNDKKTNLARQITAYLLIEKSNFNTSQAGLILGKRNHSTNGHKKAPQTPKKPRKSIK